MVSDFHVHTSLSCDSTAEMSEYIAFAKKSNIGAICFTEHVDFNKNDSGYRYYDAERFFDVYQSNYNEYEENPRIYAGIEFSEPHLYGDELSKLSVYPYDFILGSVHWVGNMFPCHEVRQRYSAKEFFERYWKEVYEMVKHGGFDCVSHMDFPKRYYQEVYYQRAMMKEIFEIMLDKNIVLEVNTSPGRKGYTYTMPGKELLEIYKECGGKYVTIGSDAHAVSDLGANYYDAKALVEEMHLESVIFQQRKMVVLR